jgi:hypothetical protein
MSYVLPTTPPPANEKKAYLHLSSLSYLVCSLTWSGIVILELGQKNISQNNLTRTKGFFYILSP